MTVDPDEVTRLRSALRRSSEGASPREKTVFTLRLKAISIETLRERLRSRAISTPWKRDLAVAEIADRLLERNNGPAPRAVLRLATQSWGIWLAGIIIALCCAIIAYAGYSVWMS